MPMVRNSEQAVTHDGAADVRRTLVRNTIWNYTAFGVNLATNVVVFPIVVRTLGDAAAGIWLLLASVTGYMGLLQLGIVPALSQFVASELAIKSHDAVNHRVSTAMALLGLVGLLPLLALPFVPVIVTLFRLPAGMEGEATLAFRLGFVGFSLQLPGHVFNALLNGALRQDRCSQVWITSTALKAAGSITLVLSGYGLIALLAFDLGLIVFVGAVLAVMAFRTVPSLRISPMLVRSSYAGELMRFGGLLFVGAVSSAAVDQTDRLVIGAMLSVSLVPYYAAAWKIYGLAYALPMTMLAAVPPMAGALFGRGDRDGLRRIFIRSTKYAAAATWPLALALGACAAILLRLWMGKGYEAYDHVTQVLLAALVIASHNHGALAVLTGMRRVSYVTWWFRMPQAVLNVGLSIWLVTKIGVMGVALGTLIPAVLLEYIFIAHILRELEMEWRDFLVEAVFTSAGPAIGSYLPLGVAYAVLGAHHLALVPVAAACTCAYAAWFWRRSLDAGERAQVLALVPFLRVAEAGA